MRTAADCYRQSDPDLNYQFSRGWIELPSPKRHPEAPRTLDRLAAEALSDWRKTKAA